MAMTSTPVPGADPASAHFFHSLDEGRLDLLVCRQCGTAHLAISVCDVCGSIDFSSEPASGIGIIYSFTRVHIAHHPAFADQLPFCGGIVELAEGPRLFAPLLGEEPISVGAPAIFEWQQIDGRGFAAFRVSAAAPQ